MSEFVRIVEFYASLLRPEVVSYDFDFLHLKWTEALQLDIKTFHSLTRYTCSDFLLHAWQLSCEYNNTSAQFHLLVRFALDKNTSVLQAIGNAAACESTSNAFALVLRIPEEQLMLQLRDLFPGCTMNTDALLSFKSTLAPVSNHSSAKRLCVFNLAVSKIAKRNWTYVLAASMLRIIWMRFLRYMYSPDSAYFARCLAKKRFQSVLNK